MKIKIKLLLPLLIVLLAAGGIFFYSNSRPPDAARVQQSFAQALTADGVHPTFEGHRLIAREWLDAVLR